LKNETSGFAVSTAENNVALAKQYADSNSPILAALVSDIDAAKKKYELDSLQYQRLLQLQRQNVGTKQQLDNARTLSLTSRETWQKAISNYSVTQERVKNDLKNATNQLKAARSQKKDFTVFATIDGRVYDVVPKIGELIGPQIPVMEIGGLEGYEVELAIDESDGNFVKPGQEVVFNAEFLGEQMLKGKILKIYPKVNFSNKSIKAIASLELPSGTNLYAGSTIEANIVYKERNQVLVLPRFYVLNDTVLVKKGFGSEKRKITTGAADVAFVEVISGLGAEEEVLRP
jgi:multidrug resistance efflux pump